MLSGFGFCIFEQQGQLRGQAEACTTNNYSCFMGEVFRNVLEESPP